MYNSTSLTIDELSTELLLSTLAPIEHPSPAIELDTHRPNTVSVAFFKPDSDYQNDSAFASSLLMLTACLPLRQNAMFVRRLSDPQPGRNGNSGISVSGYSKRLYRSSYRGWQADDSQSSIVAEPDVDTTPNSNTDLASNLIGILADTFGVEGILPKILAFNGMLAFYQDQASGISFGLRGGGTLLAKANRNTVAASPMLHALDDSTDVFLGYSAQLSYGSGSGAAAANTVFSERSIIAGADDAETGKWYTLDPQARFGPGKVRPEMHLIQPLAGNANGQPDYAISLKVEFQIA